MKFLDEELKRMGMSEGEADALLNALMKRIVLNLKEEQFVCTIEAAGKAWDVYHTEDEGDLLTLSLCMEGGKVLVGALMTGHREEAEVREQTHKAWVS